MCIKKNTRIGTMLLVWSSTFILPCVLYGSEELLTPAQIRTEAGQSEVSYFTSENALLKIKQIRQDLIDRVLQTQGMLETMEQKASVHFSKIDALQKNDHGKLLAQEPNSIGFTTFIRLHDEPAITLAEIRMKRIQVTSLLRRVLVGEDTPEAGYFPDLETRDEINGLYFEVLGKQEALDGQVAALDQLTNPSLLFGADLSQTQTLSEELSKYRNRWQELLSVAEILAKKQVSDEIRNFLVEVNKIVALENGKLESEILKSQNDVKLARKRQENELNITDQNFQLDRTRQLANEQIQQKTDDLEYRLRERRTIRELNNVLKEATINRIKVDVEKQRLIAKAESIEVQFLLGPFFGDSYWQPNRANRGLRPSPVMLSLLESKGALATTARGLQVLYTIGTNANNKDRKPWAFPKQYGKLSNEQRDQLWQAQQYLIELGPTLVELGYLAK